MKALTMTKLALAALATPILMTATDASAGEGDGFPHIAIAEEPSGELALEFEVGLDETTTPPTITLIAPEFSSFFGGYRTFPLTETAFENSDLGFVSEVEGEEEGGAIAGDILVRLLSKDDAFKAYFPTTTEIFTLTSTDFALGDQFDTHPTWILANAEGDFTPASATFEVFDVSGATEESLGQFNVTLTVPEPGSAVALLAGAGLLAARRRRR
ncbi:MAG: PEP-CTERM sorting domain-containing protein [Phycisphaeraceae bacterium]